MAGLADYFTNQYLTVFVAGKGYVPVLKSKLTDAQIRMALTSGRNQVNPKPGYVLNSKGQFVLDPAVSARPPVPAGGGQGWNQLPQPTTTAPRPAPTQQNPPTAVVPPVATPTPAVPAAPTYNANAYLTDPGYWSGLTALRGQLGLVDNNGQLVHTGAQSGLSQLRQRIDPNTLAPVAAGQLGGQTLYDILYSRQQQSDARNASLSRSEAARKGVTLSGYWDRTRNQLASQAAGAHDQLVRQYGTDASDARSAAAALQRQQDESIQSYTSQLPSLQTSSNQSWLDDQLRKYSQQYGGY